MFVVCLLLNTVILRIPFKLKINDFVEYILDSLINIISRIACLLEKFLKLTLNTIIAVKNIIYTMKGYVDKMLSIVFKSRDALLITTSYDSSRYLL